MSSRGSGKLGWLAGIGPSCLIALFGCGSTGSTPSAGNGGTETVSAGGGNAAGNAGTATAGGGITGGQPGAAGHATAGETAGGTGGGTTDFVCNPEKVTVVGELDGVPLNIVRATRTFAISPGGVHVDFGVADFGTGAFVSGDWQLGTFLNQILDGEESPLGGARLQLEAPDPRAGVELCADGVALGLRSKSEHQMTYALTRLVPLVCPGTPVEGSVTIDARVHGMVDGHALDVAVLGNYDDRGGQFIQSEQAVLPLTTDDPTGTALSGKVTGGRLELVEATNEFGDIYCVGQADFQRPSAGAFTVTLSGLSKIGNCRTSPSVGHAEVCVQGGLL